MNDPFKDTRVPLVRTMERRSMEESWANEKRLSARIVTLERGIRKFQRVFNTYAKREYSDAHVLQPAVDELWAALMATPKSTGEQRK
jgi:hypothetical protein